jgi:hypothetical protein
MREDAFAEGDGAGFVAIGEGGSKGAFEEI